MRLAWKNLCHDYLRFAVTIIGLAFAVVLMIFEGSLLITVGFTNWTDAIGQLLWARDGMGFFRRLGDVGDARYHILSIAWQANNGSLSAQ